MWFLIFYYLLASIAGTICLSMKLDEYDCFMKPLSVFTMIMVDAIAIAFMRWYLC